MDADRPATVNGEPVTMVGFADDLTYLSAPFDRGRCVVPIKGHPRKGEKMVKVRHADGRLEWHPARTVKVQP